MNPVKHCFLYKMTKFGEKIIIFPKVVEEKPKVSTKSKKIHIVKKCRVLDVVLAITFDRMIFFS